ncbi:radical SAM protein [Clostridium sediminicola]|uniref:radical SAM protein n=1 Tax=Clostridium sediminicola TaxID=3114879 RepID=UPI0031F27575
MYKPGYLKLLKSGELEERVNLLNSMLKNCTLCPHKCKVNRLKGERGYCKTLGNVIISGAQVHLGEEDELVGSYGSGTIFFSHCNLKCVFCQNYEISYCGEGQEINPDKLSQVMISLQEKKCHNINLVSPSHIVPQIVEAIFIAAKEGLNIPIVYNTGGYDFVDTIKQLEGIIDIYMPDIKFSDDDIAYKYLGVKKYFTTSEACVKEMHRQVGDLKVDDRNIAYKGLMIRHLVLPINLAGTEKIMRFLSQEISTDTYVNIMAQYYPSHKAYNFDELSRRISNQEYESAIKSAKLAGLKKYKYNM